MSPLVTVILSFFLSPSGRMGRVQVISLPGSPCMGDVSQRVMARNGSRRIEGVVSKNIKSISIEEIGGAVDAAVFEVGACSPCA